jgi:prevent-host-death family protein
VDLTRYGYNGHMATVNIAELKDRLSSFLHRVRAGEELVIRDRNLPIAKIVPLHGQDGDPEELSLVASGHMTLPAQQLDQKRFWRIGGQMKRSPKITKAIGQVIATDRKDYAGLLGHKRDHSHLRTRAKRQRG